MFGSNNNEQDREKKCPIFKGCFPIVVGPTGPTGPSGGPTGATHTLLSESKW